MPQTLKGKRLMNEFIIYLIINYAVNFSLHSSWSQPAAPAVHKTYLVKTRQRSVADNMVSCCDNADWDFCIARCKSLNIFSRECFANQQFRKMGINRCRKGGKNICKEGGQKCHLAFLKESTWQIWGLTVKANGTVVTSSRMKWKDKICCHILPCNVFAIIINFNWTWQRGVMNHFLISPCNSDMQSIELPSAKSLLVKFAQPKARLVYLPTKLRPNSRCGKQIKIS